MKNARRLAATTLAAGVIAAAGTSAHAATPLEPSNLIDAPNQQVQHAGGPQSGDVYYTCPTSRISDLAGGGNVITARWAIPGNVDAPSMSEVAADLGDDENAVGAADILNEEVTNCTSATGGATLIRGTHDVPTAEGRITWYETANEGGRALGQMGVVQKGDRIALVGFRGAQSAETTEQMLVNAHEHL